MALPDCMMPDGAEPCLGFREVATEYDLEKKENIRLRTALQKISELAVNPELGGGLWRAKKIARLALED